MQTLFDLAKSVGLWVVLRPGEYLRLVSDSGNVEAEGYARPVYECGDYCWWDPSLGNG